MKHLKTLGLVAVAIAALTAFVGVSVASAAQYKSSSSPVTLNGNQNTTHTFAVDNQNVTCKSATFTKNSLTTPANEVPGVVASYNECTAFGFAATVNMGTCTYNFDTPNASLTANVDVVCTSNTNVNGTTLPNTGDARINANVFGSECEVHVESQNNKSHLNFVNNNPVAGDVLVKASINPANNGGTNALTAEKTKDNGLCPLSGTGTVNNATYNGDTGVTGPAGVNVEVG